MTPVLDALGDPTRRTLLEALRLGPMPVGELATHVPVSRPAVSQHLRVLEDAGLVRRRDDGRRRIVSLNPDGLRELQSWLESFWADALHSFRDLAEAELPPSPPENR